MKNRKKYVTQETKFVIFSIFISFSIFLFTYTFFFQYPHLISKRSLLQSILIGVIVGYIFYIIFRKINLKVLLQDQRKWKIIGFCMSLIITVFISFLVDIPNNYLFAPEINIDIEIPPETEEGSQVTLKYIHNGLSFIDTKIISLSQGSRISDGLIILTPQENSPASVSLQGRAWNRVQFGFSDYRPGSKVIFHYDGYTDFYYFEKNAQNKEVFTTIEVPRFWFFSLISRVSTLSSIFIILLAFLFSFFCFFGDFFVNLGKKIFLFISNSVILLSAWKGNMLSKWFLWAGLAFFIPWLLNYA